GQCQKARKLYSLCSPLVCNMNCNLIVEPRRSAQAWCTIVSPIDCDLSLLRGPLCCGIHTVSTQAFRFVQRRRILAPIHLRRGRHSILACGNKRERRYLTPICTQRKRMLTNWVLSPVPSLIARNKVNIDSRLGDLRTITSAKSEDSTGCSASNR